MYWRFLNVPFDIQHNSWHRHTNWKLCIFPSCSSLNSITIQNSATKNGDGTFEKCSSPNSLPRGWFNKRAESTSVLLYQTPSHQSVGQQLLPRGVSLPPLLSCPQHAIVDTPMTHCWHTHSGHTDSRLTWGQGRYQRTYIILHPWRQENSWEKAELVFANKILYRRLFNFLLVQTLIRLVSGQ